MFTNPFNRKYESGGSVQNKANSLVEKASKNSGVSVKELTNKMNEFSSDEAKGGAFAELIKSAASDEDTKERREAVASLKAMFKKSTKFADGGKFQDFICKHGRGGNIDCGCRGIVIRGEDGIDKLPEGTSRIITPRDTTDIYYLPNGNMVESIHPTDGSTPRYRESSPVTLWNRWKTRTPRLQNAIGVFSKLWPFAAERITPEEEARYEEARRATFGTPSKEDGGVVMGLDGLHLSRKQTRELSGLNKGYNREQFQSAMANADAALRNNTELRGRDLRQAKRMMVSGITPMERVVTMESSPVELDISLPTAETISNLNPNLELPVRKVAIPTSTSTIVRTKKPSRAAQALDNAVQYFATTAPSIVGAINYEGYRNPVQNFKDMAKHFISLFKKEQGGQIEKPTINRFKNVLHK